MKNSEKPMPLKYYLPNLPIDNVGKRRHDWAYLVPVRDGIPPESGLPRMRDIFGNFSCERNGEGKLIVRGPFSQGYYMFWVYGDIKDYDVKGHFLTDWIPSGADPRYEDFFSGKWRVPGPMNGPWFFPYYGLESARPPVVRVSGEGVDGGENILSFDLKEMHEGRFNGEFVFQITGPDVREIVLDGSEMKGLCADVITLSPVDLEDRHRLVPSPLPERVKTHPRLYFDKTRLEELRNNRHRGDHRAVYADLWKEIERAIDGPDTEAGVWHPQDKERISDADRTYLCAFGYLMEGDRRCRDAGIESLMRLEATDAEWSVVDNHIAMQTAAVATGYDWLYHELAGSQREKLESLMIRRADETYRMKVMDRYFCQAHFMTPVYLNLGSVGFVLWEKHPEQARRWAAFARTSLERTLAMTSRDGVWMDLWNYSMISLVPYVEMIRQMTGEDLCATEPFFRNTGLHWLFERRGAWRWHEAWDPRNRNTSNECPWIYRWATAFKDPVLQWAADGIRPIPLTGLDWRFAQPHRKVFEYLWRDPELKGQPPKENSLSRHFPDTGKTIFRSGWDENAVVLDTRCGPMMSHTALSQGELSKYAHSPFNMNAIHLFAFGEDLLSRYCGNQGNVSHACSTVLVDNQGQGNDGGELMPEETVFSRHFIEGEGYAYVEGVATGVYPKELKLTNFTRRILHLRPDLFVLVDELAAREPRLFQWRLASLGSLGVGPERGQFSLIKGEVALDILAPWPPQWTYVIGETPLLGGYCSGMDYAVRYLGIEAPHKVWETTFVTLLTPRPRDRTPDFPQAEAVRENALLSIMVRHKGREWQIRMSERDRTEQRIEVVTS